MKDKSLTIPQAAKYLGRNEHYVRKLVHEGKLPSAQVTVGQTKVWRHEIPVAALDDRKANVSRTSRDDGRTKQNLYTTPEELVTITKLFKEHKIEAPISRANPPKAKPVKATGKTQAKVAAS